MKMNANILEKLKEKENRAGIDRITVESQFFKAIKRITIVLFAWNFIFNLLYSLATFAKINAIVANKGGWNKLNTIVQEDLTAWRMRTILIIAFTVLLVWGLISLIKKWHVSALIFNIVPAAVICIEFAIAASNVKTETVTTFWNSSNTYTNLLPLVLMALLCIWYCVAGLVHDISLKKAYNSFVDKLYLEHADKFDKLSDEEWEEFLSNYQPEKPKDKKEKKKK